MKTVNVELTVDQWEFHKIPEDVGYVGDAVDHAVDHEFDCLEDYLATELEQLIEDKDVRDKVIDYISQTLKYTKQNISERFYEYVNSDNIDEAWSILNEIEEQARLQ